MTTKNGDVGIAQRERFVAVVTIYCQKAKTHAMNMSANDGSSGDRNKALTKQKENEEMAKTVFPENNQTVLGEMDYKLDELKKDLFNIAIFVLLNTAAFLLIVSYLLFKAIDK